MAWTWRYEDSTGTPMFLPQLPQPDFAAQADAESWLGEQWRTLAEAGVAGVTLLEDGGVVYGPMSLAAE